MIRIANPFGWEKLKLMPDLTADQILEVTLYNGKGVEDLVGYLDAEVFPGILADWARQYVNEVQSLLEEVLVLDEEAKAVLRDPRVYFHTRDEGKARRLAVDYFIEVVNDKSPEYVKRAMIAFIELGLGNFYEASNEAEFAVNEKEVVDFGEKLNFMPVTPDDVRQSMVGTQRRKAELLATLIKEFRRGVD